MMRAVINFGWERFGGVGGLVAFRRDFLASNICRFIENNGWSYHTQRGFGGWTVIVRLPEGDSDYYLLKLKLDKPSMLSKE